jgi:hypothetical protein
MAATVGNSAQTRLIRSSSRRTNRLTRSSLDTTPPRHSIAPTRTISAPLPIIIDRSLMDAMGENCSVLPSAAVVLASLSPSADLLFDASGSAGS